MERLNPLSLEVKNLLQNNGSVDFLVKNTKINASTAKRLFLGENENIALSTLLEVAAFLSQRKSLKGIIHFFDNESALRKALEKGYQVILNEDNLEEDKIDINKLITSEAHYKIFLLAAMNGGVLRSFIKNEYGNLGLEAIEDFLKAGVFEGFGERVKTTHPNFYVNIETTLRFSPTLHSFIKTEQFHKATNIFHIQSEKISKECRRNILVKLTNTQREICELMEADEGQRDVPFFSCVLAESMISKEEES